MIRPALAHDALLADIAAFPADSADFALWWLGQSGFLLKWSGEYLLFDPYLSDSLTEKYAATDKPHVRMTERCIEPGALDFVRLVTSSHAHTDHLDAATLVPLAQRAGNLSLLLPEAILPLARERLSGASIDFVPIDAGKTVALGPFCCTGIPAAHDLLEKNAQGQCLYLGFAVTFGPWRLYHSGDTRWHAELPQLLSAFAPDVVLVPINGAKPERRVAGNLNGTEAAELAAACGASVAIPHHFEMFEFNTASPDEFLTACARLHQRCQVLRCGERWTSQGIRPRRQDG